MWLEAKESSAKSSVIRDFARSELLNNSFAVSLSILHGFDFDSDVELLSSQLESYAVCSKVTEEIIGT